MIQLSSIIQKMQHRLEEVRKEAETRQKTIKTLEEDIELSRKNYSTQMEVLSEHSISLRTNIERLDSLLEYIKSCEVFPSPPLLLHFTRLTMTFHRFNAKSAKNGRQLVRLLRAFQQINRG